MRIAVLLSCLCLAGDSFAAETSTIPADATNRIAGLVMEIRSGTPDVVMILCDQRTGMPISAETRLPFLESAKPSFPPPLLTVTSGPRGQFVFDHLPAGDYRVVAQKWTSPFKSIFEPNGTVIQLFGTAENIHVPSSEAGNVELRPPGDGILVFDQDVGNDSTFLLLSTRPPVADPILGLHSLGRDFITHTIGINVMPAGRTTVIGAPRGTVHAFFFAPDNSPGYAADSYDVAEFTRAKRIPFVAGWSDGRHDPPPRLQRIIGVLQQLQQSPESFLGINTNASTAELASQYRKLVDQLDRKVELSGGETATVGDLIAIASYQRLQKATSRRE